MCVFWGSTFVLIKQALGDISTLLYLTLRFGLAALVLWLFGGRVRKPGMLIGVFLFLGYALQTHGLHWTSPSKSAFITSMYVILVPIVDSLVSRKLPGWAFSLGAILAFIGLALLTNPEGGASINQGDVWTLGCMLAFTGHIMLTGYYSRRGERALDLALGQSATAAALAALTFPWAEDAFLRPSLTVWMAIAITGLICTALGFFVMAWAQQETTPSRAALIFSGEPVFAWITSAVVLGERLGWAASLGALLILNGIIAAEVGSREYTNK